MKGLQQFLRFDWEAFFEDKKMKTIGYEEWRDYATQSIRGGKIIAVIVSDKTAYKAKSDGQVINNLYEKVAIKVPKQLSNVPMNAEVQLINPTVTVYGEYKNGLSIIAEDVKFIEKQ